MLIILGPSKIIYMTLSISLFSKPQFSHLTNEEKMDIKSLPWGTVLMTAIDFDMHKRGQTDGWIERRINM